MWFVEGIVFDPYKVRSICMALMALLAVCGCDDEKQRPQTPPQLVGVAKVIKTNVPLIMEAPAKITGSLEIQVRAQVGGILKTRLFSEGQYVAQGDKLFEIDPAPYEAALAKAKGALAKAESEVKKARRDYDRMQKLHNAKAISQKDYDDSLSALESAEANLKVAEGQAKEAEINIGYTAVKAPISGIVGKEAQSVGNLVGTAGDSSLLTTMVQIHPLHAIFSISGSAWRRVAMNHMDGKVSLPQGGEYIVEVITPDGVKYPYPGKIIFVDSNEDQLTSSVSLKAEVQNSEDRKLLMPGQFVRVKIIGAEYRNVMVIPVSALIPTQMGYVVYLVGRDNVIETRPIKAEVVGNQAIVDHGLAEGDVVVSEGIVKARPGTPVNPVIKETESTK
ncbi:MAG: efflux RND transporter periplasmic adaptor subunit [Holosporaceae bacterium]|jgi:membrane fusion protein (multidrug efflux system)|nr:efflux RND transporter periplasmic adaptor subunit [Holosporaceae bacterium]